ncbi:MULTISPECIES: DUF1214 domain-containing protein [unclassified Leifsonia]|uniref:DUF1214 domain-containing protein n=1 Tax=unclassified Leifsonia TaxID=2663824 RepID=UPI000AFC7D42|nr:MULTISPECIES: DUF1214 domain-containing protein [unclassified Leifsonia]
MSQITAPSPDDVTQAWVYLLGRYLVMRQERIDLAEDGVDYNVIKHNPAVVVGSSAGTAPTFVNPNLDVVYSEAWIAVDAATPAILEIPAVPADRYYTVQIVDEWAEITHNINERNFPDAPYGRYAICLEGTEPDIPDGCLRIDIPSSKAKMLARVQIGDDVDAAVDLQHRFTLSSLGSPTLTAPTDLPDFDNAHLPGAWMFTEPYVAAALAPVDACGRAGELQPLVSGIAAYIGSDSSRKAEVDETIASVAIPAFVHFVTHFGNVTNGWSSTAAYPKFGDDFWFRATANFGGIWWNSSNEAVYELLHVDAQDQPTTGDRSYRMTFAADALPGDVVDGFWSLTVYGKPDYMLVPNAAGRFTVGSEHPLAASADGSIELVFSPELPDGVRESNWLPTPAGKPFTADLRLYLPHESVRSGEWTPPALHPIS